LEKYQSLCQQLKFRMASSIGSRQGSVSDKKLKGLKFQAWIYEKALLFLIVTMLASEPIMKRF